MPVQMKPEQEEAANAIVSWAREHCEMISTADDGEMAAMKKAGLLSGVRVDLISIEALNDQWKARLAIAGGRFDVIADFRFENGEVDVIEEVEVGPGTTVPRLEK